MENYYELYHHGVKGMKWGVRRYQNSDGTLTKAGIARYQKSQNKQANKGKSRTDLTQERSIPAGTKMYRMSTNSNESQKGSTYVSYLNADRNHYKGGYVRTRDRANTAYEYEYTLNKDLKIPSRKKQQEVINQVVRSNNDYLHESVQSWVDQVFPKNTWDRYELEDNYDGGVKKFVEDTMKQWSDNTPEALAYSVCQSMGLAPNVKNEVINELQKQGYNAMVDEASVGGQNGWRKEGYDPLVVFDASVLSKDSVREISKSEETKAYQDDKKWQNKVNSSKNKEAKWSAM